jgi:hypothetical protein
MSTGFVSQRKPIFQTGSQDQADIGNTQSIENPGPPLVLVPLHGISTSSTPVDLDLAAMDALLNAIPNLATVASGNRPKQEVRMRQAPTHIQKMR